MTGQTHPEMQDRPVLPVECKPAWLAFQALSRSRAYGMSGPCPITWLEIDAYQRVTGDRLLPWEVRAIEQADIAFMEERRG